MSRATPPTRDAYPHFLKIPTRWNDNDSYGHVNNAVYYYFIDTVVNSYLIDQGLLDLKESETIGLAVETSCQFFGSITYPDIVHAGLRVTKLGRSSVTYDIGIFRNDETTASARGHFVHVYVDAVTRRPTPISDIMRHKLGEITV
ncbi:acyl-CoA thioesterase [Litorimonas sp. RW-G-Af-16]|uniref:acyl-CoA thioesterase n=1 Tax=Litorimonas sp. RW-G-Af-16 TaxID=3241168 RepID=UPI00390C54B2